MTCLDSDEDICVCKPEVRRARRVSYDVALNHERPEISAATAIHSYVLLHAVKDVNLLSFTYQYPSHISQRIEEFLPDFEVFLPLFVYF